MYVRLDFSSSDGYKLGYKLERVASFVAGVIVKFSVCS